MITCIYVCQTGLENCFDVLSWGSTQLPPSNFLTKFVGSRESRGQAVILDDRAAPLRVTHGPDVSHPECVAGCGPTQILGTQELEF